MTDRTIASARLDRRTFLALGGGAALAAALAACTPAGAPKPTPTATPLAGSDGWTAPESMAFPKGFTWGAATSSYQVEGSLGADGRGRSIWDVFAGTPGRVRGGATGEPAADQYRRWEEDLDLMVELGLPASRFSIAWPRILPEGAGRIEQRGLDHYRRVVDGMLERGIHPAITLYHWDLPYALQEGKGGWANRDTALRFADYAGIVFDALADAGADWFTINEPKTTAFVGHWYGTHAPGARQPDLAAAAVHHQLLAHGLAVQAFRASGATGRVGIALNLLPAYSIDPTNERGAARVDASENRLFLDPVLLGRYPEDAIGRAPGQLPADPDAFAALQQPGDLAVIASPIDVLGVQYYGITGVDGIGNQTVIRPTSAASWQQLDPSGLYDLLVRLKDDYPAVPLVITENGIPDPTAELTVQDPERVEYLRAHLQQAARAIEAGVPLEGYYAWSLLDNFEWAEGYEQRWGIVAVDFETQERTPKTSAAFYGDVIAGNAVRRA